MFPNKLTMQYVLTNTLSIVRSTRVNNTVHTYTVYVTRYDKTGLMYVHKIHLHTYIDITVRISFTAKDFRILQAA